MAIESLPLVGVSFSYLARSSAFLSFSSRLEINLSNISEFDGVCQLFSTFGVKNYRLAQNLIAHFSATTI